MDKKQKKTWIQYGIFALVAITLYATGLHTEVIGFAQRGLLATGIMNPNVERIGEERKAQNNNKTHTKPELIRADFNLKLIDKDGHLTSLEEFKGKVIFMNLWATWCPPCIAEMPSIDKLHEKLGDEIAFVILSLDQDFATAKAFDQRKGYHLPIYAPASNLPPIYESSAIPTTFVIDAEGNLVLSHKGMANYSDAEFISFLRSLK